MNSFVKLGLVVVARLKGALVVGLPLSWPGFWGDSVRNFTISTPSKGFHWPAQPPPSRLSKRVGKKKHWGPFPV